MLGVIHTQKHRPMGLEMALALASDGDQKHLEIHAAGI
jgi:hypothetical protein